MPINAENVKNLMYKLLYFSEYLRCAWLFPTLLKHRSLLGTRVLFLSMCTPRPVVPCPSVQAPHSSLRSRPVPVLVFGWFSLTPRAQGLCFSTGLPFKLSMCRPPFYFCPSEWGCPASPSNPQEICPSSSETYWILLLSSRIQPSLASRSVSMATTCQLSFSWLQFPVLVSSGAQGLLGQVLPSSVSVHLLPLQQANRAAYFPWLPSVCGLRERKGKSSALRPMNGLDHQWPHVLLCSWMKWGQHRPHLLSIELLNPGESLLLLSEVFMFEWIFAETAVDTSGPTKLPQVSKLHICDPQQRNARHLHRWDCQKMFLRGQ